MKTKQWWKDNRPEHWALVQQLNQLNQHKHAIIDASVKVGKQQMILMQATIDFPNIQSHKNVFVSNFNRTDCKEQRDEMINDYGFEKDHIFHHDFDKFASTIASLLADSSIKQVIIHHDESDYGTGKKQKLSPVFDFIRQNMENKKLRIRLYSATNEEAINSCFAKHADVLTFADPPTFFGADDYLKSSLVNEAVPFWEFTKHGEGFSAQANAALKILQSSNNKTFGVLRASGGKKNPHQSPDVFPNVSFSYLKNSAKFRNDLLSQYNVVPLFIDAGNKFYWGKDLSIANSCFSWYGCIGKPEKYLLVVNQMCTRSTEVGFHDEIAFWHDYRDTNSKLPTKAYNTMSQAMLRVNYYTTNYKNPVNIVVYGHKKTFELAAKVIKPDEYSQKFSPRVKTTVDKTFNKRIEWQPTEKDMHSYIDKQFGPNAKRTIQVVSKNGSAGGTKLNDLIRTYVLNKGIMSKTDHRVIHCDGPSTYIVNPELAATHQQSWDDFAKDYSDKVGHYALVIEDPNAAAATPTYQTVNSALNLPIK